MIARQIVHRWCAIPHLVASSAWEAAPLTVHALFETGPRDSAGLTLRAAQGEAHRANPKLQRPAAAEGFQDLPSHGGIGQ